MIKIIRTRWYVTMATDSICQVVEIFNRGTAREIIIVQNPDGTRHTVPDFRSLVDAGPFHTESEAREYKEAGPFRAEQEALEVVDTSTKSLTESAAS